MPQTISLALDEFLLASRAEEKSLKTQRSYKDILEDFVKFTGNIPVDALTPSHLRGYLENVASRPGHQGGFSSSSVLKHGSVVRTFVRWIYLKRYISNRITDLVELPQPALNLPNGLNEEEVRRLFDYLALKGEFRDVVIFKALLETGLRVHEITELNLEDLNLKTRTIIIKGANGQPTSIPVGNELQQDLFIYKRDQRNCEPSEKAFFINRFGNRLESEGLNMLIKRTLKEIRRDGKCGAETLRSTYAITYLGNGGNEITLHFILRNADFRSTHRYMEAVTNDA